MKNEEIENLDFDDKKIEVKGKITGGVENVNSTNSKKNRVSNHVPTNTISNRSSGGLGNSSGLSKAAGLGASGALSGGNRLPGSNKLPGTNGINNNNNNSLNYNNNNLNNNLNGNNTPSNNKNQNKNNTTNDKNDNKDKKTSGGLNKKRDDLKNKWDNRPKTPKDFSDKAKKGLKNGANKAKDGLKNGVNKRFNNSRIGKTINKAKETANKIKDAKQKAQKAKLKVKTFAAFLKSPVGLAIMGILVGLLIIFVLVIVVPTMFANASPLVGGEVENDENYEKYSKTDQKTIDSLQTIYKKHSSGIPEYAMVAVIYPYIDEMQHGDVTALRGKTNEEQEDDAEATDDEDCNTANTTTSANTNNSDCIDEDIEEDEDDLTSKDSYLVLLRQKKFRRKFKKLLKKSKGGKDALTEYLKNTWFTKDKGYKELFDGVEDDDVDDLKEAIIDDILDQIDDFKGYFRNYDSEDGNCSTTYSSQSAGQVTVDYSNSDGISLQDLLTKNIVVDVKKNGCKSTGKLNSCKSMYSSPISMKQYIIGVTIQEVSDDLNNIEHIKANMISEKSFAIGRALQRGNVSKIDDNTYAIGIIDSTRDQDYCDYLTGNSCSDGVKGSYKTYGSNLEQAWSESQNLYLYSGKKLIGSVCQNKSYASDCSCKAGECLFQEEVKNGYETEKVDQILSDQFKNKKAQVLSSEGGYVSSTIITSNTVCSDGTDSNGIDGSNFIYYAQNDYGNTAFCGRTLSDGKNGCAKGNSICTSGCGVTSAAMVAATLTQNSSITPETVNSSATVGTDCGSKGTNASLFTHIASNNGLKAKNISTKNQIKSVLDSGGLVIANVAGVFGNGVYKNVGGHYVVIRGYSGKYVYIADPWQNSSMKNYCDEYNSKNQCTKLHTDFDTFINNVKNKGGAGFIAITGGTPFSDSGSNETLDSGTQSTYFAPVQKVKPFFGSKGSTGGCSNSVYHDISGVSEGTKIYAGANGTATFYQIYNSKVGLVSYGNVVELKTNDGATIIYAHLQKFASGIKSEITKTCPKKGNSAPCPASSYKATKKKVDSKKVTKGELIGYLGNTGNSTGAHLHVEIRKNGSCVVDPWKAFGMR